MIGPQDVGHRVVVRRVVGVRDGRPLFTDILGELIGVRRRRTDRGDEERAGDAYPLEAIVAAKRIPPRDPRRAPRT